MLNVLWLPSWYPTVQSTQNGDFIKRHAFTVELDNKVSLFYVQSVDADKIVKPVETIYTLNEHFDETIIIFKRSRIPWLNKFISIYNYIYYSIRGLKNMFEKRNHIDLVHVHVTFRAGLLGLWIKWRYGIPYILSEHWSVFLKERGDNYSNRNFIFRYFIKKIINNASALTVVSSSLGKGIQEMVIQKPFIKIPNVVDVDIFKYEQPSIEHEFTFVHVSGMNDNKNPKGIINAFSKLSLAKGNIHLVMIGDASESIISYAKSKSLNGGQIVFKGVLEYASVAQELRMANAFVLFSHSETQSCVTIEALCCGLPVIASKLPCIEEYIDDHNGMLITAGDEDALFNAMSSMLKEAGRYDHKSISEKARSIYNPTVIGQQFKAVYESVLSESRSRYK